LVSSSSLSLLVGDFILAGFGEVGGDELSSPACSVDIFRF
jgi:hypothetical protein